METIIIGQNVRFQLGLINADTHAPIEGAGFRNTNFDFSNPGVVAASAESDPYFFTVIPQSGGTTSVVVRTTAEFDGVQQEKQSSFDVTVISAPPPTELTITRVS